MINKIGTFRNEGQAAQVERTPSQVDEQIRAIEEFNDQLASTVNRLRERLLCVLAPSIPPPNPTTAMAPITVPLAERLHKQSVAIHEVINEINSIIERIELPYE